MPRSCLTCNHPLVFDKKRDRISDVRVLRAMTRLSANGALAYTENQLFHAIAGRQQKKPGLLKRLGGGPKLPSYWQPVIDHQTFTTKFQEWRRLGGRLDGTLVDQEALRTDPARQAGGTLPAEVTVHSFDRVVVVDNVATAAMLVANNFHVDHRCAVFSEDGYPERFRNELIQLLRTNPNLVVVALHGATVQSLGMAERLRAWFPDPKVRIVDAGLRPSQADKNRLWTYRLDDRTAPDTTAVVGVGANRLSEAEQLWLAWGLYAPLDSLSPTAIAGLLIKMFNGLAKMDEQAANRRRPDNDDDWDDYSDSYGILWIDGGDDLAKELADFFGSDDDSADLFGDG